MKIAYGRRKISPEIRKIERAERALHWTNIIQTRKELVEELLALQDGRCAICQDFLADPHLDHNHDTLEIRGVLCNNCNSGIGFFKEDPVVIARALSYLTGQDIDLDDPR